MVYLEGCSLCPREECVFWLLFTGMFYVGLIKSDCFVTFMSSFSLLIFCLDGLDFFLRVSMWLFIYFWLLWVFIAACRLSLVVVRGLLIEVASCCRAQTLGHMGFSSCGIQAQ